MPQTIYKVIETVTQNVELIDCSSKSEAYEVMQQLQDANPNGIYEIVSDIKYTVKGLGRDPELH
tara:strand:- start:459 stop:650 length:192 start_codon:yes stop_codon:yes gene_type:complete